MPPPDAHAERSWFQQLFELSPDPTWIIENNNFVECNEAAVRTLGYPNREALMDVHPSRLSPPNQPDGQPSFAKAERMMSIARTKGLHRFEWVHTKADGTPFTAEVTLSSIVAGEREIIYCVWRDITERKKLEDQIRTLAFRDHLTHLPNRRLLTDRLGQALAAGRRSGYFGALMLLDLDNFKPLNDTYGHAAGDRFLIEVAQRLKQSVRAMDTVSRFGGDEFVVMLADLNPSVHEASVQAETVAEKIRGALAEPYRLSVKRRGKAAAVIEHECTASIGLTLFRDHNMNEDDVIRRADAAMYEAKQSGRNTIRLAPHLPEWSVHLATHTSDLLHLCWKPGYHCGHPTIDAQHRALFSDANALLGAILAGAATEEIEALIDRTIGDLEEHFRDEEAILAATEFPGLEAHVEVHRDLTASAHTLSTRFRAGTLTSGEMFQFLAYDLIARHLLSEDRSYFAHILPPDGSTKQP